MTRCGSGILFFQIPHKPEVFDSCSLLRYMLWMSKHSWKLPVVVQNFPSGLQYSSKRKTLHESLLRFFFPFHFVVDPFLGKISVPCMPGASATKQAPRCFGDVSPWRWNERSNPRGHEEVIDQQREELEAILMLLNWIWLSMNGDWTLSFLFFCFTVLLQLCWLVWWRQQVAWRISPFCFDLCLDMKALWHCKIGRHSW